MEVVETPTEGVKQVIVMRKDLNMRKGKMIAQGSHASFGVILKIMRNGVEHVDYTPPDNDYTLQLNIPKNTALYDWISFNFKKICLYVNSEKELLDLYNRALEENLPVALIQDQGHTEFNFVPTYTCLAIGPDFNNKIDPLTKHLPLL